MTASPAPLRLTDRPGLWQLWSLSAAPGSIWVAPLDAAARESLPEKGAGGQLLEVLERSVISSSDDHLPPPLF